MTIPNCVVSKLFGRLSRASVRCRRFVVFTAVGALGTVGHYLVLIVAVELGNADAILASVLGFVTGAFINYFLNHAITFRSTIAHQRGIPRFMAVAIAGLLLNTLIMVLLVRLVDLHYLLSQVLATAVVLVWNYLGSELWAFREAPSANGNRGDV